MTASSNGQLPRFRGGVVGLGMIGRHHARLLQSSDRVDFVGAVDQDGDRYRSVRAPRLVFDSVSELIERSPDFAIVAVPTEEHLTVARQLMEAGVSVLVEKPLASTADKAREIVEISRRNGVCGAVGHVERFNAPLREMRRRIVDGQLGELISLSAIRSGPFSGRVRDVGVVKDLASHDIDVIGWLSDSRVARLAAQARHVSGQHFEDLVFVTGELESGPAFSLSIDRVSPVKIRRTRALGEMGLLEADTLTGDLFFYENAQVNVSWEATQQFRGVSEGNVTRYALDRIEPLRVELDSFLDLLSDHGDPEIVDLEHGVEIVEIAELVLASAATGQTLATVPAG